MVGKFHSIHRMIEGINSSPMITSLECVPETSYITKTSASLAHRRQRLQAFCGQVEPLLILIVARLAVGLGVDVKTPPGTIAKPLGALKAEFSVIYSRGHVVGHVSQW
ncbi:hypothetical protein PSHT_07831 [Puccinia striiformis]|uniref:Uncharacterized protein n=4 Tax=Puccinia striiformis TaxID=27350 RepID=A0A0L0UTE6_9BASI|nr:hypothetical protein PSTG_16250 [Puccinia striiformis f. sp. tritici PST-78]POW03917.1 hypothetical protein PSTT_10739 [Puccinia striiformis]POW13111.1 hypothetical protein PSHT_07831 [Puccinia striiformis]